MAQGGKRTVRLLIIGAVSGGLLLLGYELVYWLTHVYASGARVETELTRIAPRVTGSISVLHVREGDRVKQGQPLIGLVDDEIRLRVHALETELALEKARCRRLVAERAAFEAELESRLATNRERIRAVETELIAVRERLRLAEKELARVKVLYRKELSAARELSVEQDRVLKLKGESARLAAKLSVAAKELAQVEATRAQLGVFDERIRVSAITEDKMGTDIEAAKVELELRHLRSPIDGIIDRVYKHKGEYVDEGDVVLVLHDASNYWLEAQVDEDQIRHLEVGQTAILDFEAYPFQEFIGRVERIGSATARQIGIAERSKSQFGRQAERVPVRIAIEEPPPRLTPGMVANVNVRIFQ